MLSSRLMLVFCITFAAMGPSVQAALDDILRGIFKTCFGFPCVRGTHCVMEQLRPCEKDHEGHIKSCPPKQPICIRLG